MLPATPQHSNSLATLLLSSGNSIGQDSVTAKVKRVKEGTLFYKVDGMKFVSFDCKCNLKRGEYFKIPKSRFDSLLLEAKPIRKKDIEN